MLPLGSGPTRATLAWLSGALMACALIATCLLVLRSDVLPFQGSWPSLHGSRAETTELAPPPARVTGAGTGGVTALIPATTLLGLSERMFERILRDAHEGLLAGRARDPGVLRGRAQRGRRPRAASA